MDRWKGKNALVTGASSGIGHAAAQALVDHGLNVVVCARRLERLEELRRKNEGKQGKIIPIQCDVGKTDDVFHMFQQIEKDLGHIDVLINNAATTGPSDFINADPEVIRGILELNVLGVATCTKEALRLLDKDGVTDGHIININSTVGHLVAQNPEIHVYSASKHFITAMTHAVNMELKARKSKVRISSISPGTVDTEFTQFIKDHPYYQFHWLKSEDIVAGIVYALSQPWHVLVKELTIMPTEEPALP